MRRCGVCGKETNGDSEDHHAIPNFLYKMLETENHSEYFRIVLCKDHHNKFTTEWNRLRFILRKKLKKRIGEKYG